MSWPLTVARRVALVLALASGACSTVPAPIIAPVPARSLVVAPTFSLAVGSATATIQRPDGTMQRITGNGEDSLGRPPDAAVVVPSLFVPAPLSFHSADPAGDVGGFIGCRQVGISGRQRF